MVYRKAYDLDRFVIAQNPVIKQALAELEAGRKGSHWMWFIFPQLKGLGRSSTALRFGVASLDEARGYLAHPLLGPRLQNCTEAVLRHSGLTLHVLFGSPDDLKFRSSMTLFAQAATDGSSLYEQAILQFCGGIPDPNTLALLMRKPEPAA